MTLNMDYRYQLLDSPLAYEPLGSNVEQKFLDACRYRSPMHLAVMLSEAMRADPKLSLVGFEPEICRSYYEREKHAT